MNPSNLRSSWELPYDLVQAYGPTKSSSESITRKPLGELDHNLNKEWDLENNLAHSYGKLADAENHLPKFSDAEHAALLATAVNNAVLDQTHLLESKLLEWQLEREKLNVMLTEKDEQLRVHSLDISKFQKELLEAKQEAAGYKVQTKALALRVQVLYHS